MRNLHIVQWLVVDSDMQKFEHLHITLAVVLLSLRVASNCSFFSLAFYYDLIFGDNGLRRGN